MKSNWIKLAFFALFLVMQSELLWADTLILKSGKVIECKVLEKNKDYIKVDYGGRPLYYECRYIQQINEDSFPAQGSALKQSLSADRWSRAIEKRARSSNSGIKAVILTDQSQGVSPLKVVFSGLKSFSPAGKIVSYHWDLGDGETFCLPKVKNTYISMSYGQRIYTVKLTVKDDKGNIASALTHISVTNKNL